LGVVGQGRHFFYNAPTPRPDFLKKDFLSGRAKRKGVWGKEFLPVRSALRSRAVGWERFRFPAIAGKQNRKIFFFLFEKNFAGGLLNKC